jgi:hypothetical protein
LGGAFLSTVKTAVGLRGEERGAGRRLMWGGVARCTQGTMVLLRGLSLRQLRRRARRMELILAEWEQLSAVSRAFPSWNRSILTEIYLCHACSYRN